MEKRNSQEQKTDLSKKPESVFHNFKKSSPLLSTKVVIFFAVMIILGVGAGFYLAGKGTGITNVNSQSGTSGTTAVAKGTIVGSNDTSTFKDTATGVMTDGGIDGEGQYHLVRPGGDSQNVYLTSSLVDLSQFVGKKVKVNGQTQAAKKAGWLMDVGRVEVLE